MGVRERKIERYLNERVTRIGGITRKWVSPGIDGVPDRIVIISGVVYFVEVKTLDGIVSTCQFREHERLIYVGAKVHIVYGSEGVDFFMNGILNKE